MSAGAWPLRLWAGARRRPSASRPPAMLTLVSFLSVALPAAPVLALRSSRRPPACRHSSCNRTHASAVFPNGRVPLVCALLWGLCPLVLFTITAGLPYGRLAQASAGCRLNLRGVRRLWEQRAVGMGLGLYEDLARELVCRLNFQRTVEGGAGRWRELSASKSNRVLRRVP